MEVSMSKTRRGKYTDRICYISKCKGYMRLYLRRKGKLPCFNYLVRGKSFSFYRGKIIKKLICYSYFHVIVLRLTVIVADSMLLASSLNQMSQPWRLLSSSSLLSFNQGSSVKVHPKATDGKVTQRAFFEKREEASRRTVTVKRYFPSKEMHGNHRWQ